MQNSYLYTLYTYETKIREKSISFFNKKSQAVIETKFSIEKCLRILEN